MTLKIYPDYNDLSRAAADLVGDYIRRKPASIVCIASGHSPMGLFQCLVKDVQEGKLDISAVTWVSLDEWVGIPPHNSGSCRYMMDEGLFKPLAIPESRIRFFDAMMSQPQAEADAVNAFLDAGGGLDIMVVGVGLNGHIAMNEPGTSWELKAHVSALAEETKLVGQKYFQSATPLDKGITLGLRNLREARLPVLMANGAKKKQIIQQALTGPVSEAIPASIMQTLPHGIVLVDAEAGGGVASRQ